MDYSSRIKGFEFYLLSPKEIKENAVVEITKISSFADNVPVDGGLYDQKMGVSNNYSGICKTCGNGMSTFYDCPGHFGYIKLGGQKVYDVSKLDDTVKLLRVVCHKCSHLLINVNWDSIDKTSIRKDTTSYIYDKYYKSNTKFNDGTLLCDYCKGSTSVIHKKIKVGTNKVLIEATSTSDDIRSKRVIIYPKDTYEIFKNIPEELLERLGYSVSNHPKNMIIKYLPVIPPVARPILVQQTSGKKNDNPLTTAYKNILKKIASFSKTSRQPSEEEKTFIDFSQVVNIIFNAELYLSMDPNLRKWQTGIDSKKKLLSQILSKKEGFIIQNMVGKRVNFSGRTVISCEAIWDIDTIGLPKKIAMILTFPETITSANKKRLYSYILNGSKKYVGATRLIKKNGAEFFVDVLNKENVILENGDIVERHLKDGDVVIINRFPTLSKYSFSSFKIKIVPDNTIRLNIAVVKPFNADFDGDEMDIFVPRSIEAKTEAIELMGVKAHLVSESHGMAHIGPNMDSILSIGKMTRNSVMLDKRTVDFLLQYSDKIYEPLPKPNKDGLWTGKQILSYFLPKLNFSFINDDLCVKGNNNDEKTVDIVAGLLKSGVITGEILGKLLNEISSLDINKSELFNFINEVIKMSHLFITHYGSSIGLKDMYIGDLQIRDTIDKLMNNERIKVGDLINRLHRGEEIIPAGNSVEDVIKRAFQNLMTTRNNLTQEYIIPYFNSQPNNQLLLMIGKFGTGSNGSIIQVGQMCNKLGIQYLDDNLISTQFNGRTTPYSRFHDYNIEDMGFIWHSLIEGLTPKEYYFASMIRGGKIGQQVLMGDIGYTTKKIAKILDDNVVRFDLSVLNCKNQVIQYVYGVDSFAVSSISNQKYNFITFSNADIHKLVAYTVSEQNKYNLSSDEAESEYNKIIKDKRYLFERLFKYRKESIGKKIEVPINLFVTIKQIKIKYAELDETEKVVEPKFAIDATKQFITNVRSIYEMRQTIPMKKATKVLKIYFRSILYSKAICEIYKMTTSQLNLLFDEIMIKLRGSIISPGEPIGINAASAISAPTNQMILNTFHAASSGVQKINPLKRFKELTEVTKKIVNPLYDIFLLEKGDKEKEKAIELSNTLEIFHLDSVVESSKIIFRYNISEDPVVSTYMKHYSEEFQPELYSKLIIQFNLSKKQMYVKNLSELMLKINSEQAFPHMYAIVSDINVEEPIIYVFIMNSFIHEQYRKQYSSTNIVPLFNDIKNVLLTSNLSNFGLLSSMSINEKDFKEEIYDAELGTSKTLKRVVIQGRGNFVLRNILANSYVDPFLTTTNDVRDAYKTLGVEAARTLLINELNALLSFDQGTNIRHVELFADTVFYLGLQLPVTAEGLKKLDSNLMGLITFEKMLKFIGGACRKNQSTDDKSFAFATMTGQLNQYGGTGNMTQFTMPEINPIDKKDNEEKYEDIDEDLI